MSLRSRRIALVCFIAIVVASTLIAKELISSKSGDDEYKLFVESILKDAIKQVKDIRGLSPDDVGIEVVTVSWAKENWGKSYAEADEEGVLREERVYK